MDEPPKNILLVEGPDDKHVVRHLQDRAFSAPSFDVRDTGGIDELFRSIEPEIRVSDRVAVGIVVDANDSLDARWAAVSHRLREAEIEAPEVLPPGGAIMDGPPRVGVWLMPDNQATGELEDFVRRMIPGGDAVWPLAQKYIADIPEEARQFKSKKTSRAELHAWLATREEPGFMGSAIGRGDLKTDGKLCLDFLTWIEKLFG